MNNEAKIFITAIDKKFIKHVENINPKLLHKSIDENEKQFEANFCNKGVL